MHYLHLARKQSVLVSLYWSEVALAGGELCVQLVIHLREITGMESVSVLNQQVY